MSLGAAALVLTGVGTAVSAIESYQAGKAEAAAYRYNAAIAERKGIQEEAIARKRLKRLLGHQRALYAKAGVDLSEGSPLVVLADTAAEGEKEALNIRTGSKETANLYRFQASQAKKAGVLKAGATLLTGLGSGLSTYKISKSGSGISTYKQIK
jgi:hypothetical protein